MMLTLCSTKMTSEHLLIANLTTREYVFVPRQTRKINPAKLTAFTVFCHFLLHLSFFFFYFFIMNLFIIQLALFVLQLPKTYECNGCSVMLDLKAREEKGKPLHFPPISFNIIWVINHFSKDNEVLGLGLHVCDLARSLG